MGQPKDAEVLKMEQKSTRKTIKTNWMRDKDRVDEVEGMHADLQTLQGYVEGVRKNFSGLVSLAISYTDKQHTKKLKNALDDMGSIATDVKNSIETGVMDTHQSRKDQRTAARKEKLDGMTNKEQEEPEEKEEMQEALNEGAAKDLKWLESWVDGMNVRLTGLFGLDTAYTYSSNFKTIKRALKDIKSVTDKLKKAIQDEMQDEKMRERSR